MKEGEDQTRDVLATNRLAQAWSWYCERSTPADRSLIFILRKHKERYSSPDGGSLDCPCRWRTQHCSTTSSVVGRTPSDPLGVGETLGQLLRMAQPRSWAGWWCRRGCPTLTSVLEGTSDSLLKMAKSEHFQMFHSPDCLSQYLRTQKFELVERNKQEFLNFSWCLFSFQVFGNVSHWGVLEMELLVVS